MSFSIKCYIKFLSLILQDVKKIVKDYEIRHRNWIKGVFGMRKVHDMNKLRTK